MRFKTFAAILAATVAASATRAEPPATPSEIVAASPVAAWRDIAADDLLVMTLEGGRSIVIQLAPVFSQAHIANMRTLARAHWWDGTSVYRIQDNYVAQWGDRSEKKPLPAGMPDKLAEDYTTARKPLERRIAVMPSRDSYAPATGFLEGWPVGMDDKSVWLTHCYAMIGVGRNLAPDSGTGAELYAVIGHAPRPLDRNIALVGRVVEGIEHLSSLPRGTEALGMYGDAQRPTPILSARLASELPEAQRPHFQMMDTASATFADYAKVKANRFDDFFRVPAGGADICNINVPVRRAP